MKTTSKTQIMRKFMLLAVAVAGFWPMACQADILVTSVYPARVLRYDENTGNLLSTLFLTNSAGLQFPHAYGIAFGPDGNLYIAADNFTGSTNSTCQILRYNGQTDAFIDYFATNVAISLFGMAFGPDGNLYACAGTNIDVLDGLTGELLRGFGQTNLQFLDDLTFGPDNMLYVADQQAGILKFDPTSGSFISVFCAPSIFTGVNSGAIAQSVAFGPDGNLYAGDAAGIYSKVLKFNGTTGALIEPFASGGGLWNATGLVFGPDGNLYVVSNDYGGSGASWQGVLRYNGATGLLIDQFANDGVNGPNGWGIQKIVFTPRSTPQAPSLAVQMFAGITLSASNGIAYELQYSSNLNSPNWQPLVDIFLTNSPYFYLDTNSAGSPMRFYRAVIK